jgi:hypothetical protein
MRDPRPRSRGAYGRRRRSVERRFERLRGAHLRTLLLSPHVVSCTHEDAARTTGCAEAHSAHPRVSDEASFRRRRAIVARPGDRPSARLSSPHGFPAPRRDWEALAPGLRTTIGS